MVGALALGIVVFALGIFLLWVLIYAGGLVRRPPSQEPLSEAAAGERKALLATGMIIATGLLLTIYGFVDPIRQAGAKERQVDIAIERGIESYALRCAGCHGEDGKGAVVPGSEPKRVAPQLNREQFWADDPDEAKRQYELVYKTIQRGRPGTPMPPWGQGEGGTLNQEEIYELAIMITHGDKHVQATFEHVTESGAIDIMRPSGTVWDVVKRLVEYNIAHGAQRPIPPSEAGPPLPPELQAGRNVFVGKGCVACHATEADTRLVGPPLTKIATEGATRKPGLSAEDYIRESIRDPNAFIVPTFPGPPSLMPPLALTDDEVRDLLRYLLSLE